MDSVRQTPLIAEFLAIQPRDPDECWPWHRAISTQGYGRVHVNGRQTAAHRVVYELFVGPIPAGHEVDHTCHNADLTCAGGPTCEHRRCCNPAHLRTVTHRENDLAGRKGPVDTCKNGHEMAGDNLAVNGGLRPRVKCRTCRRESAQRRRSRS